MEKEILKKIADQDKKLDKIYSSVEKARKYFLFMLIVMAIMLILPLIGLIIMVPQMISMYTDVLNF